MQVRGAPLIGGAAAFGIVMAMKSNPSNQNLRDASKDLISARPARLIGSAVRAMNEKLKILMMMIDMKLR